MNLDNASQTQADPPRWQRHDIPIQVLSPGPGPGPSLLAPGVPDQLLADGHRIGWLFRGALWTLIPGSSVTVLAAHQPIASAVPSRTRWLLHMEGSLWCGDPSTGQGHLLELDVLGQELQVRAGTSWVLITLPEGRMLLPTPGVPSTPQLPDGAMRSPSLAPWSAGAGVVWHDFDTIYLASGSHRPQVLGQVLNLEAFMTGPGGAAVFQSPHGSMAACPGGSLTALEETIDLETLRFSPDGNSALAATAGGTVEFNLDNGRILRLWRPELLPVGYAPSPVFFDEESGCLVDGSERTILQGLDLAGPSLHGDHVVGPGGAAWNMSSGERTWPFGRISGGLAVAMPDSVAHLGDEGGRLMDYAGQTRAHWNHPFQPDSVAWDVVQAIRDDAAGHDWPLQACWLGRNHDCVFTTLEGNVIVVDTATGKVSWRAEISPKADSEGWPQLLCHRGVALLRDSESSMLLPSMLRLPAPDEPVMATALSSDTLYMATASHLAALPISGKNTETNQGWKTDLPGIRLLVKARFLLAVQDDHLLLIDPENGEIHRRLPRLLDGHSRVLALGEDAFAAVTGPEEAPDLLLLDTESGSMAARWPIPADGAAMVVGPDGRQLWAWTEDGSLVKLPIENGDPSR